MQMAADLHGIAVVGSVTTEALLPKRRDEASVRAATGIALREPEIIADGNMAIVEASKRPDFAYRVAAACLSLLANWVWPGGGWRVAVMLRSCFEQWLPRAMLRSVTHSGNVLANRTICLTLAAGKKMWVRQAVRLDPRVFSGCGLYSIISGLGPEAESLENYTGTGTQVPYRVPVLYRC